MTPDLFSTAIVLDTSALHGTSVSGAPFQVLKGLVAAGLVEVFVPYLAIEEFRTQWRERHLASAAQAGKALKALGGEAVLPDGLMNDAQGVASGLAKVDWETRSHQFASKYMQEHGFHALPLSLHKSTSAWADYFRGELPSKKVKHRPDLPDAHIIAALREFGSTHEEVSFVSSDKGQREAAEEIVGVTCFDSLDALVKSPKLQPFFAKWQTDQKWKLLQKSLSTDDISEYVHAFVASEGGDLISSTEIIDPAIPEDNHTALVTMYGEPDEIELEGPEDWGGGLMRYRATFFSECLLSWAVFRGDAYHLPEWVSVSGEVNEHYLDAEGYAVVEVNVDVTVKIRVEDDAHGAAGSIAEISFEDGSLELGLTGDG